MTTRIVEGKKPYTGGQAIEIDENKVISLRLRDENNLIIYDEGDDEIYVDLQLPDEITPTDAFPIGVNTGRVVVDNGWDKAGTIISAKTTSGDVIKLVYADEGTLWIDNGTGTFKQIYFKSDVDAIITTLTTYINTELAKKQNGVASATAPSNPSEGDLWYDTTNSAMKVWDGTAWQSVGTGGGSDIVYATQAEYNALLPGALTDNKHYFIYSTSGGGWQPGADTIAYYQFNGNLNDSSSNNHNFSVANGTFTYNTLATGQKYAEATSQGCSNQITIPFNNSAYTINLWVKYISNGTSGTIFLDMAQYSSATNRMRFSFENSGTKCALGRGTPVSGTFNVWNNIVVTLSNSGDLVGYLNGTQSVTFSGVQTYSTIDVTLNAACFATTPKNYAGVIDFSELIIEGKTRTAQEIADYYNNTKANYGIS